MGFRPEGRVAPPHDAAMQQAEASVREAADLARRMLPALPTHREMIEHIRTRGMSRI